MKLLKGRETEKKTANVQMPRTVRVVLAFLLHCQVGEGLRLRTISDIPSPTGIAVTDCRTVFLSSSKENALFSLKDEEMLRGTETLTKVSGGTAGHCDDVKSGWNMPSLCAYRNTVFV